MSTSTPTPSAILLQHVSRAELGIRYEHVLQLLQGLERAHLEGSTSHLATGFGNHRERQCAANRLQCSGIGDHIGGRNRDASTLRYFQSRVFVQYPVHNMRGRTPEVQEAAEVLVMLGNRDQGTVTAWDEHVKLFGADALGKGGDELMRRVSGVGKTEEVADGPRREPRIMR
jgi:hypothetical protein